MSDSLRPPERELGEIVVEPAGERRVHIGDRAARLDREEAGRRVVEEVDRVLQLLEDVLVALALARDVGDRPQRRAAAPERVERAHPDAVPGDCALARQRRRHPQFLGAALALARRLREPVDRLRHLGRAGEQPLDQPEVGDAMGAGEGHVGFVGVEDPRIRVGDDEAVGIGVGDRLGRVVAGGLPGELQYSEGIEERREDAEHGEAGDDPGQQPDPLAGRKEIEQADRGEQAADQQDEQGGIGAPIGSVNGCGGDQRAHRRTFS